MEKIFDIKLDTSSEYMCNAENWPKPVCDVMVDSDELIDLARMVFGKEDDDGYVDIYAIIDPERRLVTEFLIIFKDLDGSQEEITIKVTALASSVHYFKELEKQGGKEFEKFIAESCQQIYSQRAEFSGTLVDIVDDFLESRNVRIWSSDEELREAGEWNEDGENKVRIYGTDYDVLVDHFEETLHVSPLTALRERVDALLAYYSEAENELDFYTELAEMEIPLDWIERWYGKDERNHTEKFWKEHGLI